MRVVQCTERSNRIVITLARSRQFELLFCSDGQSVLIHTLFTTIRVPGGGPNAYHTLMLHGNDSSTADGAKYVDLHVDN